MSRFKEYATGQVFQLSLTRAQIRVIAGYAETGRKVSLPGYSAQTYSALVDKGILEHVEAGRGYQLTKEGKLILPLLRACDLLEDHFIKRSSLPTLESIKESLK